MEICPISNFSVNISDNFNYLKVHKVIQFLRKRVKIEINHLPDGEKVIKKEVDYKKT